MNQAIAMMMTATPQASMTQSKGMTTASSEIPFIQLLGATLAEGITEEDLTANVDDSLSMSLSSLIDGGFLSEVDEDVASELLALLPDEWQQDFRDLIEGEVEVDTSNWSELQQILLLLLVANKEQDEQMKNRSFNVDQLKESMARILPNVQFDDEGRALLRNVMKFLQEAMTENPKGRESGEAFLQMVANKTKPTLPLPQVYYRDVLSEITNQTSTQKSETILPTSLGESGSVMSRAEQAVIRLGDQLPKEVQQQQFLRQFQQILNRGVFTQQGQALQTLSIKLYPEHLGRVDIQLAQVEGTIVAKILASSSASRELIETQIAQLRQTFIQQQIPVERIEVAEQFANKEQEEQSSQREKQSTHEHEENQEDEPLQFEDLLNELTIDEEV